MKLGRKIATMFLCMCLIVPCFSMMANAAAEGKLSFENKEVEAGEEFTVSLTGQVDAGIMDRKITIVYDKELLQFVSGTDTTKVSDGELQYEASGEINSLYNAKEFCQLTFKALGSGTAKVGVSTYDIKSYYEINWTCHDAEVTISGEAAVTPDEPADTPEEEVPDAPAEEPEDEPADVPEEDVPAEDTPVEDNAETTEAQVIISNTTTITLISDVTEIILPERYIETNVTMDGVEYPAWQDSVNTDMYIIYAASSNGVKSLYQYDTLENTYQRFDVSSDEGSNVATDNLLSVFGDKANMVLIGAGALLVLFIIIIIVLSVKLYNRNAELDEVYDDLDQALAAKESAKKADTVVTEDDVLLETEEVEDDSEVEVEFYVEESIKEFFEEEQAAEAEEVEDDSEVEVEFYVDEPAEEVVEADVEETVEEVMEEQVEIPVEEEVFDKTIRIPDVSEVIEQTVKETPAVEYYDDEEEFYDDMDGEFFVNFIDLDD